MRTIKKLAAAFNTSIELWLAEIRAGITLVEAVQSDDFETQLRMIAPTPQGRQEIREAAIEMTKLGLTQADLMPMVGAYYSAGARFEDLARRAQQYADEVHPWTIRETK